MSVAPIWLFTGPEIGERNEAIEQLKKKLSTHTILDIHSFYASDINLNEVISLLQNGSLFADARFVVLKDAEEIKKKDDIELLSAWVASNSTEASLVLVSEEIGIDKKIEALIPKENKRIFWELFENKKEQWVQDFFRKAGLAIDTDAVQLILDLVENNTDALRSACSQFVLFFQKGQRITQEDIDTILAHTKEESPFTLFNALIQDSFDQALEIWKKLSLSKDSSPVQLIAGLTFCFRRLLDWHQNALQGNLDDFSLKKAGFTSKKAIDQYRAAARRWNQQVTNRILALLAETDYTIRSSASSIQGTLMELCLYSIAKKNGQPCESYECF